ncbi:MAG TPA: ABC transporter permease [Cellulomonas sp.]
MDTLSRTAVGPPTAPVTASRPSSARRPWPLRVARSGLVVIGLLAGITVLWELVKVVLDADDSTLPHSWSVVAYLGETGSTGENVALSLGHDLLVTARNSVLGLVCGTALGLVTGIAIAKNRVVGAALMPLTVLAQTIPIVAVAPALVLWLGTGTATKVVIATYLSFFPLTVATARGISGVSAERHELFRVMAAGPGFRLWRLEMPAALPMVFVGLETAATFSVVGAIVAELPFGSTEGLGVAILNAWQYYTIKPTALYGAALAACLLGAVVVVAIRALRALVPAAVPEEVTA